MKTIDAEGCETHVLVCTNERAPGKSCCARVGGTELVQSLKERVRSLGRTGDIWVTRTGCLGFCNEVGPTVKIQHKTSAAWVSEVTADEIDALWTKIVR
jgi:(2Fe-2S) ferredoxin